MQEHGEYTRQLVRTARAQLQSQQGKAKSSIFSSKKWRFPAFGNTKDNMAEAQQAQALAEKFTSELQILYKNLLLNKHWDVYEKFELLLTNVNTAHHLIRLLTQQIQWAKKKHGNTDIDVGIHYTEQTLLKSICRHGLLNGRERRDHGYR